MSSDARFRRTCQAARQQLCDAGNSGARQHLLHSLEKDAPELIVSDNLGAPILIGRRELDVIETYLHSLLADVIGKISSEDKT